MERNIRILTSPNPNPNPNPNPIPHHLLFVGGGSIGHIAPSVAVWEAYASLHADASCIFVCGTQQDDAAFLRKCSLPFRTLHSPRLSVTFPWSMWKAIRASQTILREEKPDCIFSKGGYVSLPLCFAAWRKGIPIVLHESDVVSGYANRIVRFFASRVCVGFPISLIPYFPISPPPHLTGNPVRTEITQGSREQGLYITGLKGNRPILLIMGGSQGALEINRIVASLLDELLLRCDVIHITGRGKSAVSSMRTGYFQTEFADGFLPHLYACADAALSRAGAGSIAELAACGIPAILVPLRGVGHDHQYNNAVAAGKTGGYLHVEQRDLSSSLVPTVHNLITNSARRKTMKEHMRHMWNQDAALQIAKIIANTLDSTPRDQ